MYGVGKMLGVGKCVKIDMMLSSYRHLRRLLPLHLKHNKDNKNQLASYVKYFTTTSFSIGGISFILCCTFFLHKAIIFLSKSSVGFK